MKDASKQLDSRRDIAFEENAEKGFPDDPNLLPAPTPSGPDDGSETVSEDTEASDDETPADSDDVNEPASEEPKPKPKPKPGGKGKKD